MKNIFSKTFELVTPAERKKFILLVLFNTLVCIADIASLALLILILAFYTQNNTQYLTFLPASLLDKSSISLVLLFFIFFSLKSIAGYIILHLQYRFVYGVATRMAADNLSRYLEGNYASYVHTPPAAHVRRISDHTIHFAHYILFGSYLLITEVTLVSITIVCILLFNASIFFMVFALLVPPVIIAGYFTKSRLKNARSHVKQASESSLQYLQEALHGYVEANIYHSAGFLQSRFIAQQRKYNHYLSDVHISQGLPTRLVEVFAVLGLLILITINNLRGTGAAVEIINIGAFMAVAYKLIPGIVKVANLSEQLKTYEFTISDMPPLHTAIAPTPETAKQTINLINFNNIVYTHHPDARPIKLDLAINKGTFVGITGSSGHGKTTLFNLLLGFLHPNVGSIEINGQTTPANELQTYWADISYVKQQPYLINDSILKNITLSEAAPDLEKLNQILRITGLDQFLAGHTDGINKIISDNGKNISGGQRQRIALARALYKDTTVLLLDEAFSELDSATEQSFLQYCQQQARTGKIILLITHNNASLSYCNVVVDMDKQ